VTFDCPRVFDAASAHAINEERLFKNLRFLNDGDLITVLGGEGHKLTADVIKDASEAQARIKGILKGTKGKEPVKPEAKGMLDKAVKAVMSLGALCHVGSPVFVTKDGNFILINSAPKYFDFVQTITLEPSDCLGRSKFRLLYDWVLGGAGHHLTANDELGYNLMHGGYAYRVLKSSVSPSLPVHAKQYTMH